MSGTIAITFECADEAEAELYQDVAEGLVNPPEGVVITSAFFYGETHGGDLLNDPDGTATEHPDEPQYPGHEPRGAEKKAAGEEVPVHMGVLVDDTPKPPKDWKPAYPGHEWAPDAE